MAKSREFRLLKDKVFKESLDMASRIGFCDDIPHEVAKSNSLPGRVLFPNGKIDIAYYFMESWLEETVQHYKPVGRFEDNLISAARYRLEAMSPYKNVWSEIRSVSFQYTHLPITLLHYWTLSDRLLLLSGNHHFDVSFIQIQYFPRRLEFKKAYIDIEDMYIKTPADQEELVWNNLERDVGRILNHSNISKAADMFSIVAGTAIEAARSLYPEPIYPKHTSSSPKADFPKADSSPPSGTPANEAKEEPI